MDRIRDVRKLAEEWRDRPFIEVIKNLIEWEKQASTFDRVWPQMTPTLTAKLAEIRNLNPEELDLAINSLPPQSLDPFINAAIRNGNITENQYQQLLVRPELQGILIKYALTDIAPKLYEELEPSMPQWEGLIESLCLRGDIKEEVLLRLLGHENSHLRAEIAFCMFRSDRQIPQALQLHWHKTIVEALVHLANRHDLDIPYDLEKLLAYDTTIATAVLEGILESNNPVHSFRASRLISVIISPLDKKERLAILHRSKHLSHSALPEVVVAQDPDLYRELLKIPQLKCFYLLPLDGNPNEGNWTELAKIAIAEGISCAEIAHAVQCKGFSWSGKLSLYYQEWIDRFELLNKTKDSDLQQVAQEGLKWSRTCYDIELKRERSEEFHGLG